MKLEDRQALRDAIASRPMKRRVSSEQRQTSILTEEFVLLAVNQHMKRSHDGGRLRVGMVSTGRGRWAEINRVHKNVVCLGIKTHRFSAKCRLYGADCAEIVWRLFMEDV